MTVTPLLAGQARAADPAPVVTTSWIANSNPGGSPSDLGARWVQQDVEGAAVDSDGTVYGNTKWDEGGAEVGVYRDGVVQGRLLDVHGWGRLGGSAIALDGTYVYQAMEQDPLSGYDSPTSGSWYGFRRFTKATRGAAALPANGRTRDSSMRIVSTASPVTGLASSGSEVYAAVAGEGKVHVYRTSDYAEVRSFPVPSPGKLALAKGGDVWVVSGAEVREYTPTGAYVRSVAVEAPTALAFDGVGRLLVTTDGSRQQVVAFDVSSAAREVETIGVLGGMWSAPRGAAGPLRFDGPVGVGADANGRVYVADGLGGDGADFRALVKDSAGWHEAWQLLGLAFVDNADLSPTSDTVAYTSKHSFRLDYTKPAGQQWVWTGHLVDRFRNPTDARASDNHSQVTPQAVQVGGQPFLFMTGMYGNQPRFYRFDGSTTVPSTSFPQGGFGWQVASNGDVYNADNSNGVFRYPFLGLDGSGNPTFGARVSQGMPPDFQSVQRIHYDPATDVMVLSGWTLAHPLVSGTEIEKLAGTEILRYDRWSQGNRTPTWRSVLPWSRVGTDIHQIYAPIGMSVAGDLVFTVEMSTSRVRAYRLGDGGLVADWAPGAAVGSTVGIVDVPDGIRAERRPSGEYVVFVEEDYFAKVLMYRLSVGAPPVASPAPTTAPTSAAPVPSPTSPAPSTASPAPSPQTTTASPSATPSATPSSSTATPAPTATATRKAKLCTNKGCYSRTATSSTASPSPAAMAALADTSTAVTTVLTGNWISLQVDNPDGQSSVSYARPTASVATAKDFVATTTQLMGADAGAAAQAFFGLA